MESIHYKSALEFAALIRTREISPVELMEETLKRIETINPILNAFVSLRAQEAMEDAKVLRERFASGEALGPLAGIPPWREGSGRCEGSGDQLRATLLPLCLQA